MIAHPHYSLRARVSADGAYETAVEVRTVEETHNYTGVFRRDVPNDPLLMVDGMQDVVSDSTKPVCGPLAIDLRVWDRDDLDNLAQVANSTLSDIRRDLDSIAGVNIYRDGFRVMPYGEPDNDWLRLDIRRVQKPTWRLSNNQIVGYIRISADANPKLQDQSNRQGLDENQALADLREIMIHLLTRLETVRYPLRKRRRRPEENQTSGLFSHVDLHELRERLAEAHPRDKKSMEILKETEGRLHKTVERFQRCFVKVPAFGYARPSRRRCAA